MDEQKIQELLQRYFDGATSLAEEHELRQFFAHKEIPASLKAYLPLFTFVAEEQAIEPSVRKMKGKLMRLPWIITTGIAASIAILFLIITPKVQQLEYTYYVDGERVYDEVAAIETAESKLQQIAMSMQKAKNSMQAFEKVQEVSSSLQQIGKVQEAYHKAEDIFNRNK